MEITAKILYYRYENIVISYNYITFPLLVVYVKIFITTNRKAIT